MKALHLGMTVGLMALGVVALAMPSFSPVFKNTYKLAKDSELGKAGCVTCHIAKSIKFNAYGEDLKKVMDTEKTKKLTADILKKVEILDSDKDGAKNLDEIKKGTLPGDPKSK